MKPNKKIKRNNNFDTFSLKNNDNRNQKQEQNELIQSSRASAVVVCVDERKMGKQIMWLFSFFCNFNHKVLF